MEGHVIVCALFFSFAQARPAGQRSILEHVQLGNGSCIRASVVSQALVATFG